MIPILQEDVGSILCLTLQPLPFPLLSTLQMCLHLIHERERNQDGHSVNNEEALKQQGNGRCCKVTFKNTNIV